MTKFNPGDRAFIIESVYYIKEVIVAKNAGGFVTIRCPDSSGGFRVRESRLYATGGSCVKIGIQTM